MEKLTNEQREARHKRANAYQVEQDQKKKNLDLTDDLRDIVKGYGAADTKAGLRMRDMLASGAYEKPSDYFKKELMPLVGTMIPETMLQSLLYEIDQVRSYPYSEGWSRRPFRSYDYSVYTDKICTILYSYTKTNFDAPYPDYLEGKVSPAQMDCFYDAPNSHNEYDIAYNIDIGNSSTLRYITDVLSGGIPEDITYSLLRAVFMSQNHELHELAGILLLAASLQEGLRQAICETCDMGSLEGFRYMLSVIEQNDLIRFSSVRRAIGTWTGLLDVLYKDMERISNKTLALILDYMNRESAVAEALSTNDSMKIHMALWSQAVIDVDAAVLTIQKIAEEGTRPQVIAAAFFANNLFSNRLKVKVAKAYVTAHIGDVEVLAIVLPMLFATDTFNIRYRDLDAKAKLAEYFADREEAEAMYAGLWKTLSEMKQKKMAFEPCDYSAKKEEFNKGNIVQILVRIAFMLEDEAKKDELCPWIGEIGGTYVTKGTELLLLAKEPKTEVQRDTVVSVIADKESVARETAYEIASKMELSDRHYQMLEDMLRFKSSDVREHVITLLLKMEAEPMYLCVERLLSDKKEEKRTAGLDILMQLQKDPEKKELFDRCLPLVSGMKDPTTKEQILIDQLQAAADPNSEENTEGYGLYTSQDTYTPQIDTEYAAECRKVFETYFPGSKRIGSGKGKPDRAHLKVLKALDGLIEEHKNDEFTNQFGDQQLLGSDRAQLARYSDIESIAFRELWDEFYAEHIKDDSALMLRASMAMLDTKDYFSDIAFRLFGSEFEEPVVLAHRNAIRFVWEYFSRKLNKKEIQMLAFAMMEQLYELAQETDFFVPKPETKSNFWRPTYYYVHKGECCSTQFGVNSLLSEPHIANLEKYFNILDTDHFSQVFALQALLCERLGTAALAGKEEAVNRYYTKVCSYFPEASYIRAAYEGIISEGYMYRHFFEECISIGETLQALCGIVRRYRDSESGKRHYYDRGFYALSHLVGESDAQITDQNRALVVFAVGVYEKLVGLVLNSELRRGDSPAAFSNQIRNITRIYGADRFVQILAALGRETLERSGGYGNQTSKRSNLSWLLSVCLPLETDTAETLRGHLAGTDITEKRLVEAALYSEAWVPVVGAYLGWQGFESACYYFIAHMNESFSERQKALFAKFTPISTEELAAGAFDIDWFREACETIGEKHFDMIYDAAKYISDGAKHTRARKYADAVRGRLALSDAEVQIHDKRNKDTLMASALIPLTDENDTLYRYKLYMQFKKESAGFGAQRKASEGVAVDMALRNLAVNSGFTDVTRLTMRMETLMFEDIRRLTEPQPLDDITLRLVIDAQGKCEIECMKGGKELKSIPAKYKKDELILTLSETKKQLTEQYRRTRQMFEQAMEDMTEFTTGELNALTENPVVAPIVRGLVLTDGKTSGMLEGLTLVTAGGEVRKLKEKDALRVAHPYDLYKEGSWRDWQKYLFDHEIAQAFRQVFRELYVKTDDELGAYTSLRYAGNQIQPQKTVATLKSRRWVADVEDGLQKVYYKQNIIARIYALADWFSPADIEAPTLEWVDFFDRKTDKPMKIDDIPDILFSEVMRDVDLAVSVAHVGGVDPEASHSTVELRRAVCEFTMPLFGLTNVTFEKNHAFIKGELADYAIHLGSGVVHIQGGAMVHVLPVHSQHRGRLFLPFVDDDPKTAQILSEILLFAKDKEIKDPFILQQIR